MSLPDSENFAKAQRKLRFVLCDVCRRETMEEIGEQPGERVLRCTRCERVWTIPAGQIP